MSKGPILSIGLPAFNSGRTLSTSISSIAAQSSGDWELLVMDDGSHDETVNIARSFGDERIKVVSDGVHRGLPAQLNRAVDMARGRYFARMDADDVAYPSRLQKQIEFLESHPEVDLLGTSMTVFHSDGNLLGARRVPASHAEICVRPWSGFPMAHPTWMGKIEWFRKNRYDERAIRMEDRELLLRSYRKSCFANLPEALLAYREDSLSMGKLLRARKNTCKMAVRYAFQEKRFVEPGLLLLGQCVRAGVETVAIATGLKYRILRNRAQPTTEKEQRDWRALWSSINQASELRAAGCRA